MLERTRLFFTSSQLQLITVNQLLTVGVTQTSVCSIIYVTVCEDTSEICILLRFCFTFFYGTMLTFKTSNQCVYPEQNIGAGNMVIFDIFMVAIFVELLSVISF